MNNNNSNQYYEDEIDLRQIFKSLKERSRFIFTFTGVVTLIVIGYVLFFSPPSQYKVETSFLKPSEISVIKLNQYSFLNETTNIANTTNTNNTAESVFNQFLTTLNSKVLQREVFIDSGYAEKLGKGGAPSISITKDEDSAGIKLPHILRAQNSNPDIVSEFLNEVVATADKVTINYFLNLQNLKISNRLIELTTQRLELLSKAQKKRFNDIVELKDAAILASSLNIIESNLSQINKGSSNMNLSIAIQSGANIPDWYLYGETVLLRLIESLENRASDEPYIPELVQLNTEISKLESISLDSTGINAMQLYQTATSQIIPTKSKNRLIIVIAFIASFMLSILLVFLMNALKEEDVTSIQKGK